jgi:hypothetical protein
MYLDYQQNSYHQWRNFIGEQLSSPTQDVPLSIIIAIG